ncbi:unnamed protein product [Rotaria socialis]|uniref:Fork-head domain-containing protein n=1 Tax=Rotaria socialis TaxID=392032 RepID=A0A820HLJ9_9BILA|nr:unnamed protein product [Rotaria socialis]CAF3378281.1 unnamed protein product [Rotaria socialis]CAF3435285.1 unnamed protein product [Rotaria socialis]CAF3559524.1 unnamed protein product [Rotaria socialis]CAF3574842.1 unnamed protein product [Rotaria socialis]
MFGQKSQRKKKMANNRTANVPLGSSLTSMDWLPKMQIGENPLPSSTTPTKESLPIPPSVSSLPVTLSIANIPQKIEPTDIELPTSTTHLKPPYSYVTLIRQAILSAHLQRMTLNEIYQWIIESYPYFRSAPPKWKNSIRHNLSLNKCFKRLQRSTNDPGKGSYWALDEANETNHQSNSRKRRFETQKSLSIPSSSSSPGSINQGSSMFHSSNPMIYGDVNSVGGQSLSADESDSTMSLAANSTLIHWDDMNLDLTASFRRFREQVLDAPSTTWITNSDNSSTNAAITNSWGHDLFPHGEANGFFESVKMASSGEIDWNDVEIKPYCEFLDGFRTNTAFQQQDRDKLLNLASSLTSFFDYTGISNLAQNKIANESITTHRLPMVSNGTILETNNNLTALPVVIEDEAFDWDSIT